MENCFDKDREHSDKDKSKCHNLHFVVSSNCDETF